MESGRTGRWLVAAIHALHLMGAIRTPEALQVLLATVRARGIDELGGWVTEHMPSLSAHFGPAAIAPLMEFVMDERLDGYVRAEAATALGVIAHHYVAYRAPVIGIFRQVINDATASSAADDDYTFITLIIDDLAQFKDQAAFLNIKRAFAEEIVDEFFITIDDVMRIYFTPDEELSYHRHEQGPMDHFAPQNIERLFERNYGPGEKRARKVQAGAHKKIGRNDPCPCGSGKKYKKCCLRKERASTAP